MRSDGRRRVNSIPGGRADLAPAPCTTPSAHRGRDPKKIRGCYYPPIGRRSTRSSGAGVTPGPAPPPGATRPRKSVWWRSHPRAVTAAQAEPSGALRRAGVNNRTHPRGPETRAQRGARRPHEPPPVDSTTTRARRTRRRGAAGAAGTAPCQNPPPTPIFNPSNPIQPIPHPDKHMPPSDYRSSITTQGRRMVGARSLWRATGM